LTEALQDRHEGVRSEAVAALGRIKDARAVMPLVVAAQDEVFTVRAKVMWALGELAGRDGLPVVIAGLRDSAASVRANAARALGMVGDTAQVYYLEPLLADDDDYVRELTVRGLGRLGGGQAVNLVVRQAHDASANVRRSVIEILEHLGQDSGSAVILQACSDPETLVASKARMAARGLSTDRLLQALKDSAVGRSGQRIALDLIVARTDKDSAGRLILSAIPEWNSNHVRAVIENTVIEGMNRDQVRLAMGDPTSWQVFPEGDERWIYSTFSFMILIKNGVVTGLEPKPGP
jgi:HEAT repeat protein